tara:strand:- start:2640 stop:3044 length:405 start_codon:yes stop_codon:yes gene_type:complete
MKLKSNLKVVQQRIAICESCNHFRKRSRTCGTPIVGNKVGNKRTCGCFMDVKTKLSFSTCPLDKWGDLQVSKNDYLEMKRLLLEVKNTINPEQKTTMYELLNKYTGGSEKSNNCVPCLKGSLKEIEHIVSEYEK